MNPGVPDHPVRFVIRDDLRRNRLTVFFRLLLAIPHYIWFVLWSLAVILAAIAGWIAALVTGSLPGGLHRFFCAYIRYTIHLFAYLFLVANPYPGFSGAPESYPIDVALPDPAPQERWRILLRLVLAVPALIVSTALSGGGTYSWRSSNGRSAGARVTGVAAISAVLGWFASLATGRMPSGLRDAGGYTLGYRAQLLSYLLLVTERYPNADPHPLLADAEPPPPHPVHVVGDSEDLRRSRVTVLFRLPLVIPLLVWLLLWAIAAVLALFLQWFVTLFRGVPASALHRFLSRFVRYSFHIYAFASIAANPFPGFTGTPGVYPVDLMLPEPGRQNRWKTLFRLFLAIPAFAVQAGLGVALVSAAFLTWFVALATGQAPEGLRNLSVYALRYSAQVNAYVNLLTDAYPHASPLEGAAADEAAGVVQLVDQAA
jgi:ABC-type multidrug transport system fused ATPase/permease subunit